MRIEWDITKPRGFQRPVCTSSCTKADWEMPLRIPQITLETDLPDWGRVTGQPEIDGDAQGGPEDRTGEEGRSVIILHTPSWNTKDVSRGFYLGWREDGQYPELHKWFATLREEYEKLLALALASGPLNEQYELDMSLEAKKMAAPYVAEVKMLGKERRKHADNKPTD